MRIIQLVSGLVFIASTAPAQKATNIRAEADSSRIIITYDLKNTIKNSWIDVKIYGSHNSFATPINNTSGALGKVELGSGKQIVWQYGNELDHFDGELSFEIETELVYNLAFNNSKKFIRRGKDNVIAWQGARSQDSLTLELRSPSKKVIWQASLLNKSKTLNLKPEPKLALGKGYELQISSKNDKTIIPIQVKRKVDRFWIVSPVVIAVGFGVYSLLPKPEHLPTAPPTPDGN